MSSDTDPLDEVGEALALTVAYVEDVIEDLKAATQEAVRDERFDEVESSTDRLKDLRSFTDDVAILLARWRATLVRPGSAVAGEDDAETMCRLPVGWDQVSDGFASGMGPPPLPVMGPL